MPLVVLHLAAPSTSIAGLRIESWLINHGDQQVVQVPRVVWEDICWENPPTRMAAMEAISE